MSNKKRMVEVCLLTILALTLLTAMVFGQSSGSLSGVVYDASKAVLPGATVTAVNVDTGVETKTPTNNSGVYTFPSLQPGLYNIAAEKEGFLRAVTTDVRVGLGAQIRLNFDMAVAGTSTEVEVTGDVENMVLEAGSSTGTVLQEDMVNEIPLLSNNVMDLINLMGGVTPTDDPIFSPSGQSFAGVSSSQINVQRDGMSVGEVRWAAGITSTTTVNTEMVGEFKMILSPVDAEMGRGAGQVQMTTKSGSNVFHGSAVWNNQNTALDAREFEAKRSNTPPSWRNLNNYTLSASGPIIKNRTFFFATWDHQIAREKVQVNSKVLTPCARKGIYRYLANETTKGWIPGNRQTALVKPPAPGGFAFSAPTRPSVNADGTPLLKGEVPDPAAPGTYYSFDDQLHFQSVFGELTEANYNLLADPNNPHGAYGDCADLQFTAPNSLTTLTAANLGVNELGPGGGSYWTSSNFGAGPVPTYRYSYDPTGYMARFLYGAEYAAGTVMMPPANNYEMGDGLNYAGFLWTRAAKGSGMGTIYGNNGDAERKSITFKIDHNINNDHRMSGTYTYETHYMPDNDRVWPEEYGGYSGRVDRKPQNLMLSLTSTLRPTLLNELRFGLSRTSSMTNDPMHGPDGKKMLEVLDALMPDGAGTGLPLLVFAGEGDMRWGGSNHPYGNRGNIPATWGGVDPRWQLADTITWMKGSHAFKGGVEYRRQSSTQNINGIRAFTDGALVSPSVFGGMTELGMSARGGSLEANNFADLRDYAAATSADRPGYLAGNYALPYQMMGLFAGSLRDVTQFYYVNPKDNAKWNDVYAGDNNYNFKVANQELSFFFKDDWKVTSDLTLNLGVRYEYYGVPHTGNGRTAGLVGGSGNIFGITAGGFEHWMNDRAAVYVYGDPEPVSQYQFIGPDSENPDIMAWHRDMNNFAPHVGFAWQLPWFGRGKTTLRGGYSISYAPINTFDMYGIMIADVPGVTYMADYLGQGRTYMDLTDLNGGVDPILPMPDPIAQSKLYPLNTPRPGQFTGNASVVDENIRNPYTQSINVSLTRNIGNNLTVDVRYIGTLGRDQLASTSIGALDYINNGLINELNIVRGGGQSDVINSLIPSVDHTLAEPPADWPAGVPFTGSDQLRYSTSQVPGAQWYDTNVSSALAMGNYQGVANILLNTNGLQGTGGVQDSTIRGLVLRNGCLPGDRVGGECVAGKNTPWNYLNANPQFASSGLYQNRVKSNYHSMQVQVTMRPTRGLSFQTTYTWSRNLSDSGWTNYLGERDYLLVGGHRSHTLNGYGTWALPFGANGFVLRNANGALKKAVEGWQLGWIVTLTSGQPTSITGMSTLWGNTNPTLVRPDLWDNKSGEVQWDMKTFDAGYYFGEKYVRVPDQWLCAGATEAGGFRAKCSQAFGSPQAIALASGEYDPNTKQMLPARYTAPYTAADGITYNAGDPIVIFRNADPNTATAGNFRAMQITGQGRWTLDMNLGKSIEFMEGKRLELRIDAQNILNHATPTNSATAWSSRFTTVTNPQLGLNSSEAFGYLSTKGGHRTFQAKIRLAF